VIEGAAAARARLATTGFRAVPSRCNNSFVSSCGLYSPPLERLQYCFAGWRVLLHSCAARRRVCHGVPTRIGVRSHVTRQLSAAAAAWLLPTPRITPRTLR
jgi:hypothetical protein